DSATGRAGARRPGTGTAAGAQEENDAAPRNVRFAAPASGDRLQQVGRGVLGADLVPGLDDLSLLVYEEGRPEDAHVLAAVHGLLGPDVVRLGDRVVLVGEQREAERVL